MILTLGTETYGDLENGFFVDSRLLKEPGVHLFIASHHWDVIVIKDVALLPDMKISVLNKVADKILVNTPEKLTESVMHKLVSLFPEKAGSIRRCYMTNGKMEEVLQDCLAQSVK